MGQHDTPAPLLAVVGMCGTGKSEVTRILVSEHGFAPIQFGQIVLDEVKRRGLAVNLDNERIVREDLRRQHGMHAIAQFCVAQIRQLLEAGQPTVIDGLYSLAEYEFLKAMFIDLRVLAVYAEKTIRYERMASRACRPLTPIEVDERDLAELKNLDKGGPIAIADLHCINECTVNDLRQNVSRLLEGSLTS